MHAYAIDTKGEGRCGSGELYDLRVFWRAMTGGPGGRERGPGEPGSHGGRGSRGRHRGFGHNPWGGPGDFQPGAGGFGRGRKARRGDIRTAALLLLAEEPRNGYQIMQEVQERSDGVWRPSPGSVYPALQQLEDEGLIRSQESDGRKLYALTDAGHAYLEERGSDRPAPWEQMSGDVSDQAHELGTIMREVGFAFMQVLRTGSDAQMERAKEVLVAVRRDLYRILADGEPESR
jgi:DNA-binding PadR family transcriptional regulator